MKLRTTNSSAQSRHGFTLPELTIAMGIFLLMIAGVISSHIFGLKMYEIARVKLGASDKARKAISTLCDDIRRAKVIKIGSGTSNSFKEIALNAAQEGNAIRIYMTDDTSQFVQFYRDKDKALKRMSSNNNVPTVIAGSVTNDVVFKKQDANGITQTNDTGKYVIDLTLQFNELEFMSASVSSNGLYDHYELKTKVTPRN